ncbi:MAG TPA: hypothetical protein VI300_15375 [Solirubrobacter sp.]
MSRRLHALYRAVLLACLFSLLAAASASADDTLSLSVPAGAVEDVQTTITATWTSDDDTPWLALFVKPGVGGGCAVGPSEEDLVALRISGERPPTLDPAVKSWTPHEPGPYTVCGYVRDDDYLDYTVASFELNVRSPAASVAIQAPPRVDPGQAVSITVPASAELARHLYLTVKSGATGLGCGASYAADAPMSRNLIIADLIGAQAPTITWTAPKVDGSWLFCAYVVERSIDPSPEAAASLTVSVAPDPCVQAVAALTAASKTSTRADANVRAARSAYNRADRAARRAHGRSRARLRRQASRKKAALRRTITAQSRAHGALDATTAAKVAACGS